MTQNSGSSWQEALKSLLETLGKQRVHQMLQDLSWEGIGAQTESLRGPSRGRGGSGGELLEEAEAAEAVQAEEEEEEEGEEEEEE